MNILPSVGADSIAYYISLMIAWRIEYRALWDNDPAGNKARAKAAEKFGEAEASRRFFNLSQASRTHAKILQELFAASDIVRIKKGLALPSDTGFDKTLAALFYSLNRQDIVNQISSATKSAFEVVFATLTSST